MWSHLWRSPTSGVDPWPWELPPVQVELEVISRLVRMRIPDVGDDLRFTSGGFVFGFWHWHLAVVRADTSTRIILMPVDNLTFLHRTPSASFVVRVFNTFLPGHLVNSVDEYKFESTLDLFCWEIPETLDGSLIVDVEFLDLKHVPDDDDDGGDDHPSISGWPCHDEGLQPSNDLYSCALGFVSRMLTEGIHTDVTITTADGGSLRAHKAMLAAASPVFQDIFAHDCKEKQTSAIEMTDISSESCSALLRYIYGILTPEELWNSRMELLAASDKYFMGGLKGRCEESLMADVSSVNALDSLLVASLYRLGHLEEHCWTYLFDFGKIHDVRDSVNEFLEHADRELVYEFASRVALFERMVTHSCSMDTEYRLWS